MQTQRHGANASPTVRACRGEHGIKDEQPQKAPAPVLTVMVGAHSIGHTQLIQGHVAQRAASDLMRLRSPERVG